MEELARTSADLEGRVRHLTDENEEHRERERILKATLLTAQRASEDIRTAAHKEAERIVQEAQEAGERLSHSALQRSAEIEKAIQELKIQRANFRLQLQKMIELFSQVLEFDRDEGEKDRPLSYLTRKTEKEARYRAPSAGPIPPRDPQRGRAGDSLGRARPRRGGAGRNPPDHRRLRLGERRAGLRRKRGRVPRALCARVPAARTIDATAKRLLPGFVDAHTHPVWAGDRGPEIGRRLARRATRGDRRGRRRHQRHVRATRARPRRRSSPSDARAAVADARTRNDHRRGEVRLRADRRGRDPLLEILAEAARPRACPGS